MTTLYLGTHRPSWLRLEGPPLMVSRNTMPKVRLPRAVVPWVLDSGGFTEMDHGGWRMPAKDYARLVRRYHDEIGSLVWAAPQDWMCEPIKLAKTGKTVAEHQRLTTENYLELSMLDDRLPIIPVLQGWTRDDYLRHVEQYAAASIDLSTYPTVGVGSVCRRQHSNDAVGIFRSLNELGINLHGFGLKAKGIAISWPWLKSADSLAWSLDARLIAQRVGSCDPTKRKSCANCRHFALAWYERAARWAAPIQGTLDAA